MRAAPLETWDAETVEAYAQPYLDYVVTAGHAQAVSFCASGQRRLFHAVQASNPGCLQGVTFEHYVKYGVTVRWLIGTGHPYALTLARDVVGGLIHDQ